MLSFDFYKLYQSIDKSLFMHMYAGSLMNF